MPTAQGFVPSDGTLYFCSQSAIRVPGTTFKGGLGVTEMDWEPVKDTIKGVSMLGAGTARQQQIPTGVSVTWSAKGWGTMDQLPAFLNFGNMVKGTTTPVATTGFSTPYTMQNKNINKQYMTMAFVQGETTTGTGTGLIRSVLRDAVAQNKTFHMVSKQAFTWEMNGLAINEGPGAASTFAWNSAFNLPNISNALNAITYPSFFPAGFCSTSLDVAYTSDLTPGPYCFGTSEPSDLFVDNTQWSITGKAQADTNFANFYRMVQYGTTTPAASASDLISAMPTGALTILVNSDNTIPSSSPATPYSWTFTFPSLQYSKAKFTQGVPVMGDWMAESYGSDATATVVNVTSSAGMTI